MKPILKSLRKKIAQGYALKYGLQDIFPGLTSIQSGILADQMGMGDIYESVWLAKVCGDTISANVALMPTRLENIKGEPVTEAGSPADSEALRIYKLLTEEPNFVSSGFELMQMQVLNQIFNGNAYTRVVGLSEFPKTDPKELWPLFSDSVRPELNGKPLTPENLKYEDDNENKIWNFDEIIQVKEPNRKSLIKGLPWTVAAAAKLAQVVNIAEFQNALLNNGAFPTINISTEADLTQQQRDLFRDDWKKHQEGVEKAGKMLFTANGLKAIQMSMSPSDMELQSAEKLALAEVATIFRFPAELLGALMDKKNVATYREALKQLYMMTLIPIRVMHNEKYSRAFWPEGEYSIKTNLSSIAAIRPETADLVSAYWLTPNEKRIRQGDGPADDKTEEGKLMSKFYLPTSLSAIEDIGADMAENNEEL